jgi:LysM repeat protein
MKKVVSILGLLLTFQVFAENSKRITNDEYIAMWSATAMENMMNHKIPASITLAQGILESGSGNSDLAINANNHFGIKCHDWKGEKVYKDDDAKNECFRKYDNAAQSYADHSEFLTSKNRYSSLFTLDISDYKGWANGLKAAGYATNPKYPTLLIDLIERLNLHEFDALVLNSPGKSAGLLAKKNHKNQDKQDVAVQTTKTKHNSAQSKKQKAEVEVTFGNTRETFLHANRVKYVIAKKGDTYYKIAEEMGMTLMQIESYNDVKYGNKSLKEGDIVNIHPKRSKGKEEFITLSKDMTVIELAQQEGVKVKSLVKKNHLSAPTEVLKKGQKVALK